MSLGRRSERDPEQRGLGDECWGFNPFLTNPFALCSSLPVKASALALGVLLRGTCLCFAGCARISV